LIVKRTQELKEVLWDKRNKKSCISEWLFNRAIGLVIDFITNSIIGSAIGSAIGSIIGSIIGSVVGSVVSFTVNEKCSTKGQLSFKVGEGI